VHRARTTLQIALYLLVWGEASNLRFCPEFLAWLYHKMAGELVSVMEKRDVQNSVFNTYLGDVIKPAYGILAKQVSSSSCMLHSMCLSCAVLVVMMCSSLHCCTQCYECYHTSWLLLLRYTSVAAA
jgi:1,3-beta-glucan synthase subunit FKS1, domain-1